MTEFQSALLDWYWVNRRVMPWRKDNHADPYAVWVSEAMLQQTTVAAVVPYFERWMERFPVVEALAEASSDEVMRYWQGLGYYSRARNLLAGAKLVVEHGWPDSVERWRALPGVGEYTAGAVASIAQSLPAALVDGNVERVYSRLAMDGSVGADLKKAAWKWARQNLAVDHPGDWNQALMELGSTVCLPRNPLCGRCPVPDYCKAAQADRVGEFPSPKPKMQWIELNHVTVVPVFDGKIGLIQVEDGAWWSGLWHPPRGDAVEALAILLGDPGVRVGAFNHVVTRHKISLEVRRLDLDLVVGGLRFVPFGELEEWPISAPGRKAIEMILNQGQVLPGLG